MAVIALTSVELRNALPYLQATQPLGLDVRLLMPEDSGSVPTETLMEGVGGLLLSGGPDVDPEFYGATPDPNAGLYMSKPLDDLEFRLLEHALQRDMPVLAICRGMQVLNVAFGGQLIQDLPGHRAVREGDRWVSESHQIYLAPGAKAAPIIGSAGFFRVNSRHHQGVREPQKSPRLMATAYSVEDGYIEGLESPEHSWVIGLQCHPERQDEVPASFANLFKAFKDRAESHAELSRV
jgi:putative glutamine amidotransferase